MTDLNLLKTEIETFAKSKNSLLAESKGKFVLIKGQNIVGTFVSYEDALSEGYKQFGNKPFLVKEINPVEEINYFTRLTIA
jgi:hypothetical protein